MLAVTEIISQLKWMHFNAGPHKLADLELYDSASRGPWGALRLAVGKNKTALLAVAASLITIAALLIDPFIQLVFTFPTRLTLVAGASVPILSSQVYDPQNRASRFGQCYGPSMVDSVLQAAVLAPAWNATRAPSLPCGFERCEWPTITTLGVCSSCSDVTGSVISECQAVKLDQIQCDYQILGTNDTYSTLFAVTGGATERLPYQPLWNSTAHIDFDDILKSPGQSPVLLPVISRFTSISFAPDLPWASYIKSTNTSQFNLTASPAVEQALMCEFQLCARTFKHPVYANFSAGLLSGPQTALNISYLPADSALPEMMRLTPITLDHIYMENTTFAINKCDYTDLAEYMKDLFTVQYASNGMTNSDSRITPNIGPVLADTANVTALLQQISDSMTEVFRTAANSTASGGTGFSSVTYIDIAWRWLALPAALVSLTLVILIVVILRNRARGVPAWKSSSLALLFHQLEGWNQDEVQMAGPRDLDAQAHKMTAQSFTTERGEFVFAREKS